MDVLGWFLDLAAAPLNVFSKSRAAIAAPVPAPVPPSTNGVVQTGGVYQHDSGGTNLNPPEPQPPQQLPPPNARPPIINSETTIISRPPGNDVPPFVPVIDKIPVVGSILTSPIKLGMAIFGGLNQGDINDFDPWQNPDNTFAPRALVLRVLGKEIEFWDPATGRYLNPDGTLHAYNAKEMDTTGRVIDAGEREKLSNWKLRWDAAQLYHYDRSKVGADGYTPIPAVIPTTPATAPIPRITFPNDTPAIFKQGVGLTRYFTP